MLQIAQDWKEEKDKEILAQIAVQKALNSDWNEAAKVNERILELDKTDTEALNRLAHAYMCQGKKDKAKVLYEKVLGLDPYNIIATKNMDKITKMNGFTSTPTNNALNISNVFVSEPGKTKLVNLLNLAPPSILAALNCGDEIQLNTKKHSVCITTLDGTYLGALPDDLAHRLIGFISGGNKYKVFVKYSTTKSLTIFIKEVERADVFTNQPSFTDTKSIYFEEKDFVS